MNNKKPSPEEKAWLGTYDITRFPRPSVAADMAVFSIMETAVWEEETGQFRGNYRKDPEKCLKLLLIRRGSHPYKDCWALPGGFCRPGESIQETAKRELKEETGVEDAYLNPFSIFSEPERDPRGWIISHGFLALMDGGRCELRSGSDAWEARWFSISMKKQQVKKEVEEAHAVIENEYELHLHCEGGKNLSLKAVIQEQKTFQAYHETVEYRILETGGLAFDHAKIILCAYLALREEAGDSGRIVFDLMPETFTLKSLQSAYETIQGRPLLTANFRRKIGAYVKETEEIADGAGHRPARLYRRNLDAFYEE